MDTLSLKLHERTAEKVHTINVTVVNGNGEQIGISPLVVECAGANNVFTNGLYFFNGRLFSVNGNSVTPGIEATPVNVVSFSLTEIVCVQSGTPTVIQSGLTETEPPEKVVGAYWHSDDYGIDANGNSTLY